MTRSNAQANGKRILIMAAGTGGHVYPALTTAAMLQQHDWKVEWLGTGKGIETRLVPDAGLRLHCVDVVGLRGKLSGHYYSPHGVYLSRYYNR